MRDFKDSSVRRGSFRSWSEEFPEASSDERVQARLDLRAAGMRHAQLQQPYVLGEKPGVWESWLEPLRALAWGLVCLSFVGVMLLAAGVI